MTLTDDLLSCELVAPSYPQTRSFSPSFHGIRQNTRQRRNAQSEVLFTPRLLADYRVSVFKTTKKAIVQTFLQMLRHSPWIYDAGHIFSQMGFSAYYLT